MRLHHPLGSRLALLVAVTLGGCGPRLQPPDPEDGVEVVDDVSDESTSTGDAGHTATSTSPASSGEIPIECPEGEVACGSECANLRWSEDHCGACGHACMVIGLAGECWEGICPPTRYCSLAEQGHETCASVCASYGETCVDAEPDVPGSCGSARYGLFYGLLPHFDCQLGALASSTVMGGCNDPIRWDLIGGPNGGSLPGAVSCCCTQP